MKHQFIFCCILWCMLTLMTFGAVNGQAQEAVYQIVGYDGIKFGFTFEQLKKQLASLQGISRTSSGEPFIERVPNKPYYRYYVQRSKARGELNSEVIIYFQNRKVIRFQDVFGGTLVGNTESAIRTFNKKTRELTKVWGVPTAKKKFLVTWIRDDGKATLGLELPANQYALPILKLVVAAK